MGQPTCMHAGLAQQRPCLFGSCMARLSVPRSTLPLSSTRTGRRVGSGVGAQFVASGAPLPRGFGRPEISPRRRFAAGLIRLMMPVSGAALFYYAYTHPDEVRDTGMVCMPGHAWLSAPQRPALADPALPQPATPRCAPAPAGCPGRTGGQALSSRAAVPGVRPEPQHRYAHQLEWHARSHAPVRRTCCAAPRLPSAPATPQRPHAASSLLRADRGICLHHTAARIPSAA
jgi:hypothetical protein